MKVTKKRLYVSMIYIVVFIFVGIAMSATSSETMGFDTAELDISITDLDDTEASRALAEYIGKNNNIVEVGSGKDAALDALYYRSADVILTINEGYSERIEKGETDGLFSDYRVPGSYSAEFFDSQLNKYIGMISAYTAGGMTVEEAAAKTAKLAENEIAVELVSFSENSNAEFGENISYYYQYLAYILVVTLICGLCPTLLVMTRSEIRNRTNCSCVSSASQMTQIVLGTIIFSVGVYLLLTIAAFFLYSSQMINSTGLLAMLNGFVFLIFATMLTLLISVISPGSKAVSMIANVISLGMSFLCGVFVPQYLLSDTVLNIGKFLPAYWYVRANNMLAGTKGEIFSSVKFMTCIVIEIGFSIALFCVTILVAKTKRSSKSI